MSQSIQKTFKDFPRVDLDWLSASYLLVSQVSCGTAQSFKVNAIDLAAQLLHDYTLNSSIKSMAFEDSSDYAKISHDHDIYTSAYAMPNTSIDVQAPILSLKDLTHSTQQTLSIEQHLSTDNDILKDVVLKINKLQPYIGEMRMESSSDFSGISMPSFDGWVPVDGASYSLSDFYDILDLSTVFTADEDCMFSVPIISNFFKLSPELSSSIDTEIQGQTHLVEHTHRIVDSIDQQLKDARIRCSVANNGSTVNVGVRSNGPLQGTNKVLVTPQGSDYFSYGKYAHYGTGDVKPQRTHCITKLDQSTFVNSGLKTLPAALEGTSKQYSYPSHNTLSAFVYIGRSISSANLHDPMPYFGMSFDPNGGYFSDSGTTSISTLILKSGCDFNPPKVESSTRKFECWWPPVPRKVPIGDRMYVAQWGDPLLYEVKFFEYDFTNDEWVVTKTQEVEYGQSAEPPNQLIYIDEEHPFIGWSPSSYRNVTSNLDISANYTGLDGAMSQLVTEGHGKYILAEDDVGFTLGMP